MSLVRAFLLLQHQYSSVYFELSGFIYYRCFVSNPFHKTFSNPRVDEEGKALMINISSRAAERLREITDPSSSQLATKEENPYHHLRITVTSGGCHGFQYLMSLEAASKIDPEEDTVFEAEPEQGTTSGAGEAKVVMDEPSLELLSGSTVDYTMELIGSQFKIVDNPRATSNCGCGTSFDVKD
ncbi:[4Fe-4S] proteins maturation [Aspergillus fumigatus]